MSEEKMFAITSSREGQSELFSLSESTTDLLELCVCVCVVLLFKSERVHMCFSLSLMYSRGGKVRSPGQGIRKYKKDRRN